MTRRLALAALLLATPVVASNAQHVRVVHGDSAMRALHAQLMDQVQLDSTERATVEAVHSGGVTPNAEQMAVLQRVHERVAKLPLDSTQRALLNSMHMEGHLPHGRHMAGFHALLLGGVGSLVAFGLYRKLA